MKVDDEFDGRIRDAVRAAGDAAVAQDLASRRSSSFSGLKWAFSLAAIVAVAAVGYPALSRVTPSQVETSAADTTVAEQVTTVESEANQAGGQAGNEEQTGDPVDDFTGRSDAPDLGEGGGPVTDLASSLFDESMLAGLEDGRSFDPLVGKPLGADVVAELALPAVLGVTTASCDDYCRSEFDGILDGIADLGITGGVMTLETADEAEPFSSGERDGLFLFVAIDGSVVGRDWFEVDATDISRLAWLAETTATVASAPVGELAVTANSSDSVVAVDQFGAVLSLPVDGGAPTQLMEADDNIERAWSIGDSETLALSMCCEPASGTVLLVDRGLTPDPDAPGFDASGFAVSSDGTWLFTEAAMSSIHPATSPFDSDWVRAGTPGDPPRGSSWVPGESKLYLLRTSATGTFVEVAGFDEGLRSVVERSLWQVSPNTTDVAVDEAGNLLTLVVDDGTSTIERRSGVTGEIEESIELGDELQSLASDPSGVRLAGLTNGGTVLIYDTETLMPISRLRSADLRSVEW